MTSRSWLLLLLCLVSGCTQDQRRTAGFALWLAGDACDVLVHGAKYRAAFATNHPECVPSSISVSNNAGSGTCTTTRGCRKEVSCFLDCGEWEQCP